jgi:hypothetical protein
MSLQAAPPAEVSDLVWCQGAQDCFDWPDLTDATGYEMYRGTAADLPSLLDAGIDSCRVGAYVVSTSGYRLGEAPRAGEMLWFLVRAVNSEGPGSVGDATTGPRRLDPSGDCVTSCQDDLLNGYESDVDCGGPACPGCLDGRTCLVPSDCVSGVCTDELCECTCVDGIWCGDETDLDCGGPVCLPCPDGWMCAVPSDCQSGVCDGHCIAPTCDDGVMNGEETGVDCGGPVCPPCG